MIQQNQKQNVKLSPRVKQSYLRFSGGCLVEKIDESDSRFEEAVKRTDKNNNEVFDLFHGNLTGTITGMFQNYNETYDIESFNITFNDPMLKMSVKLTEGSRCWCTLCEAIPNIALSEAISLTPFETKIQFYFPPNN